MRAHQGFRQGCDPSNTFICYAYYLSTFNSAKFIALFLDHLRSYGLDTTTITIQTDNGAEFVGSVFAKKDSSRIEDEFYGLEDFSTLPDLPCRVK